MKKMQQLCNNQSYTTALQLHILYVHNYKKIRDHQGVPVPLNKSPLWENGSKTGRVETSAMRYSPAFCSQAVDTTMRLNLNNKTALKRLLGSRRKKEICDINTTVWCIHQFDQVTDGIKWEYKKRGRKDHILTHVYL